MPVAVRSRRRALDSRVTDRVGVFNPAAARRK